MGLLQRLFFCNSPINFIYFYCLLDGECTSATVFFNVHMFTVKQVQPIFRWKTGQYKFYQYLM